MYSPCLCLLPKIGIKRLPVSVSKLTVAWKRFPCFNASKVNVISGDSRFSCSFNNALSRFNQNEISCKAVPEAGSRSSFVTLKIRKHEQDESNDSWKYSYFLNFTNPAVDSVLQLIQERRVLHFLAKVRHLCSPAFFGRFLDRCLDNWMRWQRDIGNIDVLLQVQQSHFQLGQFLFDRWRHFIAVSESKARIFSNTDLRTKKHCILRFSASGFLDVRLEIWSHGSSDVRVQRFIRRAIGKTDQADLLNDRLVRFDNRTSLDQNDAKKGDLSGTTSIAQIIFIPRCPWVGEMDFD